MQMRSAMLLHHKAVLLATLQFAFRFGRFIKPAFLIFISKAGFLKAITAPER